MLLPLLSLTPTSLSAITGSSAIRLPSLGFAVNALVGGTEDFGEDAEFELPDEGEGDESLVPLRPAFKAAHKLLHHAHSFTSSGH